VEDTGTKRGCFVLRTLNMHLGIIRDYMVHCPGDSLPTRVPSSHVCMYVPACMHISILVHIRERACLFDASRQAYVFASLQVCLRVCLHACLHPRASLPSCPTSLALNVHGCMYVCAYLLIHIRFHVHIYMYIYIYICTHMYIQVPTLSVRLVLRAALWIDGRSY